MTQPKHALPRHQPQIPDGEIDQDRRADRRARDNASLPQDADEDALRQDASHQDALHQDAWVTNFIGRLAGLVRHIGSKK